MHSYHQHALITANNVVNKEVLEAVHSNPENRLFSECSSVYTA
jgi:hypothetical protein